MPDRYTSPSTSKLLAEAGLSQTGHVWCSYFGEPRVQPWCHQEETMRHLCTKEHVRALDLTDVLNELTRPRPEEKDARPLCEKVYVLTQDSGRSWNAIGVRPDEEVIDHDVEINGDAGEPPVEAAALVLLALLRERRETEADIDKSMRRSMDGPDPDLLNAIKASAMTRGKRERKS